MWSVLKSLNGFLRAKRKREEEEEDGHLPSRAYLAEQELPLRQLSFEDEACLVDRTALGENVAIDDELPNDVAAEHARGDLVVGRSDGAGARPGVISAAGPTQRGGRYAHATFNKYNAGSSYDPRHGVSIGQQGFAARPGPLQHAQKGAHPGVWVLGPANNQPTPGALNTGASGQRNTGTTGQRNGKSGASYWQPGLTEDTLRQFDAANVLQATAVAQRCEALASLKRHCSANPHDVKRYQQLLHTHNFPEVKVTRSSPPEPKRAEVAREMPMGPLASSMSHHVLSRAPLSAGASAAAPSSTLPVAQAFLEESKSQAEYEEIKKRADEAKQISEQYNEKLSDMLKRINDTLSIRDRSVASMAAAEAAEAEIAREERKMAAHRRTATVAAAPAKALAREAVVEPAARAAKAAVKAVDVVDLLSSEEEAQAEEEEEESSYEEYASEQEEEEEEEEEMDATAIARYQDATTLPASTAAAKQVLVEHRGSNIDLTRNDLACMAPLTWLNDEVINCYMGLLQDRDTRYKQQEGRAPRCFFWSSFFMNKLLFDEGYKYKNVRRWTNPKRLEPKGLAFEHPFECDTIFIPINLGQVHWTSAVIRVRQQQLIYYDSMQSPRVDILQALAQWVEDEYKDKFGQQVDTSSWARLFPEDIPRQKNGADCGMFTLAYAEAEGRGAPFNFDQGDMGRLRVKFVNQLLKVHID